MLLHWGQTVKARYKGVWPGAKHTWYRAMITDWVEDEAGPKRAVSLQIHFPVVKHGVIKHNCILPLAELKW